MGSGRDWRKIENDKEKYDAYLCSREWGLLREAVHKRARGKCERCFVNDIEAVHHLTYARKYNERLDDLQGICSKCHKFSHGRADYDPQLEIRKPFFHTGVYENAMVLQCPICGCQNLRKGEISTSQFWHPSFSGVTNSVTVYCRDGHQFDLALFDFEDQLLLATAFSGNASDAKEFDRLAPP